MVDTWKMAFNTDKWQILQFPKQDHNNLHVTYRLNGKPLALINSFKYLGCFYLRQF